MKLTIEYPDTLPDVLHETREQMEAEMRTALAVKLFEMKRISSGIAAQLAGMERVNFLLNLSRYGVNAIDLSKEDLINDVANV